MAAAALYAVQAGMQGMKAIGDAYRQQAMAQLQSSIVERNIEEMEFRNRIQMRQLQEKESQAISEQTAAFVKSGVEMTGSAMSVLSDTVMDAAEAAYIRQMELDYEVKNMSMEKAQLDMAASNRTLLLNIASGVIGAGSSYAANMYQQNRARTQNRGTSAFDLNTALSNPRNTTTSASTASPLGDAYAIG